MCINYIVLDVPQPRLLSPASVNDLTVSFAWLPPLDVSGIAYPLSYKISVTSSLSKADVTLPVHFDFVTNDTQLTVRSCELQEGFVIQPYTWSIATVVEGITSDDRRSLIGFQFNRCKFGIILHYSQYTAAMNNYRWYMPTN